jgi:hypothetical protein
MSDPLPHTEQGQESWSAGVFLSKAKELSRRLKVWEITDYRSPVQLASQQESRRWVRLTFREIISGDATAWGPRPKKALQYFMNDDGKPDENDVIGVVYENPDRDTNRSLTQWLLGDFLRHLNAAPPLPALDYLKGAFDQILDCPAWTIVDAPATLRPEGDSPRPWMVTGLEIPSDILDVFEDAAAKLLDAAPSDWSSPVEVKQQAEAEPSEGSESDSAPSEEPPEREREILSSLLLLGATTKRRRVSRRQAARKADPESPVSTFNRPIVALVERGYVHSKKGPDGGIWLSLTGEAAAKSLRQNHQ